MLPASSRKLETNITLNVNDRLTFNISMQVGQPTETVSVQASPVQVQLQTPETSTTITGAQIRELGIVTRNYEQLVTLMPGVAMANTDQLFVGISSLRDPRPPCRIQSTERETP